MAEITGLKKVLKMLQDKKKLLGEDPNPEVTVGYTQNYALYVHENMEFSLSLKNVKAGRGAKYLEEPYRLYQAQMVRMVKDALKSKVPLPKALLKAGLFLQRESQKRVPIDTGALRASAFTKLS
jgi:hypothetical protein